MKLAIIGTAGRKEDADLLNKEKWDDMKRAVYDFVKKYKIDHVISGGAAYADHLAVGLFNAGIVKKLELALPCKFDTKKVQFHDTGVVDWKTNPGNTSNYYHLRFSTTVGIKSLQEIKTAIEKGATVIVENGFMERNSIVAEADMVLAMTFGKENVVKDGGTANTCNTYLTKGGDKLFHLDLNTMKLYDNGRV